MKRWIYAGLVLAAMGLGAWTYRDTSAVPDPGSDLAAPVPRPDRPVLRLEGFTGADQGSTLSREADRVEPSRSGPPYAIGGSEKPL